MPDLERIQQLQKRFELLLGYVGPRTNTERFCGYFPEHAKRASALATLCEKIAEEVGGIEGLEAAVDELSECVPSLPDGMVNRAAQLFIFHYPPAQVLSIPSL